MFSGGSFSHSKFAGKVKKTFGEPKTVIIDSAELTQPLLLV